MAVSGRYTVVLDACVLYPFWQRDLLLSLAHADLYTARWTEQIEAEWTRSLIANKPESRPSVERVVELMRTAIPDCLITGYEPLIAGLQLPDPSDRHVLAAAIRGNADAIVTSNTKDFPRDVLDGFGIELQTPDQFVVNQINLNQSQALAAIKQMRARWNRPELTAEQMVDLFAKRGLGQTASHLADVTELI